MALSITLSQSLLRQRILPDTAATTITLASPTSQSLLRQRILPDLTTAPGTQTGVSSQSLLRQRILPDKNGEMRRGPCSSSVSIASSSANTPGLSVSGVVAKLVAMSQSLLRQRILPDLWRQHHPDECDDTVSIASSSANTPGRFNVPYRSMGPAEVSIASSSANTPGPLKPRHEPPPSNESQSLLRQRILPDTETAGANSAGVRWSQSLLRQRILPDSYCSMRPLATTGQVSIASSSANTPGQ